MRRVARPRLLGMGDAVRIREGRVDQGILHWCVVRRRLLFLKLEGFEILTLTIPHLFSALLSSLDILLCGLTKLAIARESEDLSILVVFACLNYVLLHSARAIGPRSASFASASNRGPLASWI